MAVLNISVQIVCVPYEGGNKSYSTGAHHSLMHEIPPCCVKCENTCSSIVSGSCKDSAHAGVRWYNLHLK